MTGRFEGLTDIQQKILEPLRNFRYAQSLSLALTCGGTMFAAELLQLLHSSATMKIGPDLLGIAALYFAVPVVVAVLGAVAGRQLGISGPKAARRALAWVLGVAAIASVMLWVYGEATILGHRWRIIASLLSLGLLPAVALVHRWKKPSALTWVRLSTLVWCISNASTRLPRDLFLNLYNYRWMGVVGSTLKATIIMVGAAVIWWLLKVATTHPRRPIIAFAVFGVGIAATGHLLAAPDVHVEKSPQIDIVYVVLDSLRADHATPQLMPNLTALGKDGVSFNDAFSPSIMTSESLPHLLGRAHGADFAQSLPGQLSAAGYRTHLLSDYPGTSLSGSEIYQWSTVATVPTSKAFKLPRLVPSIIALVSRDNKALYRLSTSKYPFNDGIAAGFGRLLEAESTAGFYMIHLATPHAPYNMAPYRSRHPSGLSKAQTQALNEKFRLETGSADEIDVAGRKQLYALAVRAADEALGDILAQLKSRPADRKTLIIVSSDHGEPFGDHGAVGHGRSLYKSAYHVPIVISGPGFEPGIRVSRPVSGAQIPATILQTAGLKDSPRSLSHDTPTSAPVRTVAVWFPRGTVIQHDGWRLIFTESSHVLDRPKSWAHRNRFELFDVAADPEEARNVFSERRELHDILLSALSTHWLVPAKTRARAAKALAETRGPN